MVKIIEFPTGKILHDGDDNFDKEAYYETSIETLSDKISEISSKALTGIEEVIEMLSEDIQWLREFDIRTEGYGENKDAFVILNLLYATIARYSGLSHTLQEDLDELYIRLKAQQELNDDIT